MRFQTRIFLTVICVALVPIILCFALVETIIGSSSAKHRMIGTSATQITVRKMRV